MDWLTGGNGLGFAQVICKWDMNLLGNKWNSFSVYYTTSQVLP